MAVAYSQSSVSTDQKYFGKKFSESSKKQNSTLSQASNYLHSTCIALDVVSHPEMVQSTQEDWRMCVGYTNSKHYTILYKGVVEHPWILVIGEVLESILHGY